MVSHIEHFRCQGFLKFKIWIFADQNQRKNLQMKQLRVYITILKTRPKTRTMGILAGSFLLEVYL